MHDRQGRERKAATMIAVLGDYFECSLSSLDLVDIGASTGIIDNYLSQYFRTVVGIDIDHAAIDKAGINFVKENLAFKVADAMNTEFSDCSADVVICSQVYEHVPDAKAMFHEIFRILKPGGVCYFAASNRLMLNEPHYDLPLLSIIPRFLAHRYVRWTGRGTHYHELHFSYWGLRKLVKKFRIIDYTGRIISNPEEFHAEYMIPPRSRKSIMARKIQKFAYWLLPGYIWILEKRRQDSDSTEV